MSEREQFDALIAEARSIKASGLTPTVVGVSGGYQPGGAVRCANLMWAKGERVIVLSEERLRDILAKVAQSEDHATHARKLLANILDPGSFPNY